MLLYRFDEVSIGTCIDKEGLRRRRKMQVELRNRCMIRSFDNSNFEKQYESKISADDFGGNYLIKTWRYKSVRK